MQLAGVVITLSLLLLKPSTCSSNLLTTFCRILSLSTCRLTANTFSVRARLSALAKPNGGVRRITVGVILRKLVSATLAQLISPQLPDTFYPHQHEAGIRGGSENVVQGLVQVLNPENVVVGIDFSNAFNTVARQYIADEIGSKSPQLRTWFELCYGKSTKLLVRGPFFFCPSPTTSSTTSVPGRRLLYSRIFG